MTKHGLKIDPAMFDAVSDGRKKAEYRKNDRNFLTGDTLVLGEYYKGNYTGRSIDVTVTHIVAGGFYGIPPDYCMLSTELIGKAEQDDKTIIDALLDIREALMVQAQQQKEQHIDMLDYMCQANDTRLEADAAATNRVANLLEGMKK